MESPPQPSMIPAKKSVAVISISFLIVMMSFESLQNLQSSINHDGKTGLIALFIIYCEGMAFAIIYPFLISVFGAKNVLLAAWVNIGIFTVSNFYPEPYIIFPASVLLGLTFSAQGIVPGLYLSAASRSYLAENPSKNTSLLSVVSFFNGIFVMSFKSAQITGNFLSSLILSSSTYNTTEIDENVCGAYECTQQEGNSDTDTGNSTAADFVIVPPEKFIWNILISVFLLCVFVGFTITLIFLPRLQEDNNRESVPKLDKNSTPEKNLQQICSDGGLNHNPSENSEISDKKRLISNREGNDVMEDTENSPIKSSKQSNYHSIQNNSTSDQEIEALHSSEGGDDSIKVQTKMHQILTTLRKFRKLLKSKFVLMIPLFIAQAMQVMVLFVGYTQAFVSCALGVKFVGYTMMAYGGTSCFVCVTLNYLARYTGKTVMLLTFITLDISVITTMLLWKPDVDTNIGFFFIIPAVCGLTEAIATPQFNALISTAFHKQEVEAFSLLTIFRLLGMTAFLGMSMVICLRYRIFVTLTFYVLGLIGYVTFEVIQRLEERQYNNLEKM